MKKTSIAVVLSLLVLAVAGSTIGYAQSGNIYFITDVDSSAFPDVGFELRAVDLRNEVVTGLSSANIVVYEDGEQVQDLQITPHSDGPITWVFVVDQGRNANYFSFGLNNIRSVMTNLVSGGYFKDGRDTVTVLARQNINSDQTVELLPPTQSGSDLTTWAANYNFSRSNASTKGLLGVEDGIDRLSELVEVPGSETTAVVFLTRYIEDPSPSVAETAAQNTAALARSNYTAVHPLQTDPSRLRQASLQIMAEGSNGLYSAITGGNYLPAVSSLYEAIDSQRTHYSLSYRSASAEPGPREITINTPERPSEGAIGIYEMDLQSPEVGIVEPVPGSAIRREASYGEDGETLTFDSTFVPVEANVTWPDGLPRRLVSAELFANGNLEDRLDESEIQETLEFSWDASDIVTEGLNPVLLEIAVKDELDLIGSRDSTVNVEVILPPPPETGLQLPSTAFLIGLPALCFLAVLALGAVGGAYYLIRVRPERMQAGQGEAPDEVGETVLGPDAAGALPLATLTVLEGPKGMIDETLTVQGPKTSIGRLASLTDIAFYADETSSISRIHATIELGDDRVFRITDVNSTAGTRLNGRKIQPDTPVVLAHGDEIVLGNLAARGVKLRFNHIAEGGIGPHLGTADDRTHYMGDGDPPAAN